jgi:hypothetical protein
VIIGGIIGLFELSIDITDKKEKEELQSKLKIRKRTNNKLNSKMSIA